MTRNPFIAGLVILLLPLVIPGSVGSDTLPLLSQGPKMPPSEDTRIWQGNRNFQEPHPKLPNQPGSLPLRPLTHLHRLTVNGDALGPVLLKPTEEAEIRWELHDVPDVTGVRVRIWNAGISPAPSCTSSDPDLTIDLGYQAGNPEGTFTWSIPADLGLEEVPSPEFYVRGCLYGDGDRLLGSSTNVVSVLLVQLTHGKNRLWVNDGDRETRVSYESRWPFRWQLFDPSNNHDMRGLYLQIWQEDPSGRPCEHPRTPRGAYRMGVWDDSDRTSFQHIGVSREATVYVRGCPVTGPEGAPAGPPTNTVKVQFHPDLVGLLFRSEVYELTPMKSGAVKVSKYHDRPGRIHPWCGIARGGLASKYWRALNFPIGFTNWKNKGRRRCEYGISHTFVSRFQFSLADLPPVRRLESAHLEVGREFRGNTTLDPADWEWENSCEGNAVRALILNSRDWPSGKVTLSKHQFRTDGSRPWDAIYFDRDESIRSVDLTDWVGWWMEGRFDNAGIGFVGRSFDYEKEKRVCLTWGRPESLRLRLTFRPEIPWFLGE